MKKHLFLLLALGSVMVGCEQHNYTTPGGSSTTETRTDTRANPPRSNADQQRTTEVRETRTETNR